MEPAIYPAIYMEKGNESPIEVNISIFGKEADPPVKGRLLERGSGDFCILSPEPLPADALLHLQFSEAMEGPNGLRNETFGRICRVRYAGRKRFPYEIGVEPYRFPAAG